MLPPNKDDGTLAIQNSADLMERTDKQLLAALMHANTAGVATREAITNELQRRELVKITDLSKRLEGLTRWLIGWTIVLVALTIALVYFTVVLARQEKALKRGRAATARVQHSASLGTVSRARWSVAG